MVASLFFVLAFIFVPVQGALCPIGWQFSNDTSNCYLFSPVLYSFDEAAAFCTSNGGALATVSGYYEKNFLVALTNSSLIQPWIGVRRNATTGYFYNLDGSFLYSSYWLADEPALIGDCVTFKGTLPTSGMKVTPCYNVQPALCRQAASTCNGGNFGSLATRTGTIQSPNYPIQYYNNLNCKYVITAPNTTYITINFSPYLVESYVDYVDVYDGDSTSYLDHLGSIDGYWSDRTDFESTKNQMTVVFKTNSVTTNKGWLATWKAKTVSKPIYSRGTNGTLESPNYPKDYDSYTEQTYYIQGTYGFGINMTFDVFNTENRYDVVEVYNSSYITSTKLIANLTGSSVAPWTFLTPSNYVTLRFLSDSIVNKSGWHLYWSIF